MLPAYLLIVHGSQDPHYAKSLSELVTSCRQQLPSGAIVAAAWLELAVTDLPNQITAFTAWAISQGCNEIRILPLFLAPGVHVNQDIPAAIAAADLPMGCHLKLLEPIGNSMAEVLNNIRLTLPPATILLVHGSRSSSLFLPNLAASINAHLAYWAIPTSQSSSFAECAAALANQSRVGVLLYFLFPGKITTAITESINELRLLFPQVQWQATPPLAMVSGSALGTTGQELVRKILEVLQT
jgi:sirohydrochlorin cobaltochelatase